MGNLFDITPPPQTIKDIHKKWHDCKKCFFAKQFEQPCLPNGAKNAKVLVVGQWPGQEDMKNKVPFSGPQGKVSKEYLWKAGFLEQEMFYTNILMCTPPMSPNGEILDNCRDSLDDVISVVKPELIIAMGSIAAERFKLKEVPGRAPTYRGIKVITVVHPAAIARAKSAEDKRAVMAEVESGLGRAIRVYRGWEE